MADFAGMLCTDADLYRRSRGDFALLSGRGGLMAAGQDGAIGPGNRWLLQSASVDFVAAGLGPGFMAFLTTPGSARRLLNGERDALEVAAATAQGLLLKRPDAAPGEGSPPFGPGGGNQVSFRCPTQRASILDESRLIREQFGDAAAAARPERFEHLCAIRVIARLYLEMAQAAGAADAAATYMAKRKAYLEEAKGLAAELAAFGVETPAGPAFGSGPLPDRPRCVPLAPDLDPLGLRRRYH
jgi:hypothetical protein